MIQLQSVTKRFEGALAVDDVSLDAPSGATTVLIGPSGSGKSTLLRLIIGLVTPDAGRVTVNGQLITRDTVRPLRHRMGYVIQEGGLFPHLTARANVTLLARHLGWSADRVEARVEALTDLVQLAPDRLAQHPDALSGGQRQRVSLMRALMLDPDVLLLDEPLGALDPMIRADLQRDLRDIFRRLNKTVVFVTHDIGEAGYVADHVALLRKGHIAQRGSMHDLVHNPQSDFVEAFVQAQRAPLENLD